MNKVIKTDYERQSKNGKWRQKSESVEAIGSDCAKTMENVRAMKSLMTNAGAFERDYGCRYISISPDRLNKSIWQQI